MVCPGPHTLYTRVLLPLGLIPRRRENVEPLARSRGSGGFQRLGLRMIGGGKWSQDSTVDS